MINKRDYIKPSAQLCANYRAYLTEPGFILRKLETIIGEGFYQAAEIRPCAGKAERKSLARLNAQAPAFELTVWLSSYIRENELNVSSTDPVLRKKTTAALMKLIDEAAESGIKNAALFGGDDVGVLERSAAYEALVKTMDELCAHASQCGINILIKPSGRYARVTKKLLALSPDVREILNIIKKDHDNLYVIYDAAHVALNHEDLISTLELFGQDTRIIRFSNAILNFDDPHYGNRHLAPGEPGFLTARRAQELLSHAFKLGLSPEKGMMVCVPFRQEQPAPGRENRAFNIATDFLKQVLFEFALAD